VANHLPVGPADQGYIAAVVSVIDTAARNVTATIKLPNGAISLKGICISPDGRHVYVTHILARYTVPTTQLERGWINTNALSIIDAQNKELIDTVLLDDVDNGAANPWAVGCSRDGKYICVTHTGTHELSIKFSLWTSRTYKTLWKRPTRTGNCGNQSLRCRIFHGQHNLS